MEAEDMLYINLPKSGNYILNGIYQRLFVKHDESIIIINLKDYKEVISKINNNLENFIVISNNEIREYFENIFKNNINIKSINGIRLEVDTYIGYICDYCSNPIEDIINDYYYYCYKCHKDMCIDCFEKENESCKNFHNNKIKKRNVCDYNSYYLNCNKCSNKIIDPEFYSDEIDTIESYDLCIYCYEKYPNIVLEKNLHKVRHKFPCDNCNFGNMLDWIPFLKDKDNSYILINKNTMEYCISTIINLIDNVYYVLDLDIINDFINIKGKDNLIIFNLLKNLIK